MIAFDIREGCPQGWQPFSHANGRFIIGAGDPARSKLLKDANGDKLQDRVFGLPGGAQQHTLTIEEMPKHFHKLPTLGLNNVADPATTQAVRATNPGNYMQHFRRTDGKGGSRPHNNMPPYIALYFCKKVAP